MLDDSIGVLKSSYTHLYSIICIIDHHILAAAAVNSKREKGCVVVNEIDKYDNICHQIHDLHRVII
jgi:hypothetical protein